MRYPYTPDVVGNALGLYGPGYGYGPYGGGAVIGADPNGGGMDAGAAMAAQQAAAMQAAGAGPGGFGYGAYGGYGWPWGCPLPPAMIDPRFPQRELKSVVAGAQCGPLETETFLQFDNAGLLVEKGKSVQLVATANVPCKVIGIKIGSNQASNFDITDAKAGILPIFAGSGQFSAVNCQENATHNILNTPSLQVGQKATVTFLNTSHQDAFLSPVLRVVAVFFGGVQLYGGPVV